MKLNWGARILILYLGFAGLIIFLVASSINEKIDLVTPDYYERELVYQNKKESIERHNALNDPATVTLNNDGVLIKFPSEFNTSLISGSIIIFRPSDKNLDFTTPIKADNDLKQYIPKDKLKSGLYRVSVDYRYNDLDYFTENQIVIP